MSSAAHENEEDDPQRETTKIGKACEPCRRRKVKCDGAQPCSQIGCQKNPSQCIYRDRTRIRRSRARRQTESNPATAATADLGATASERHPAPSSRPEETAHQLSSERYQENDHASLTEDGQASGDHDLYPYASIVATHDAPQPTDSSQLFYGPSSNFAFLQQLHRGILFKTARSLRRGGDVEEGGPGLDLFMQRSIFFGAPQRVKPNASLPSFSDLTRHIPLDQLDHFLDTFKTSHLHIYPFLTSADINGISRQLHGIAPKPDFPPQKTAIALAILALGALSSPHTEQAEYLYALAKREAVFFDEAVTLSMIQFSVLLSGYQTNMARPNSAYIHLGTACRNAFSMGLHRHITAPSMKAESVQERIATIWCLYFHETKPELLQIHSLYYHAILHTFRPFLVASAAMSASKRQAEGMWLRQACRHAVDAAQDSIVYIGNVIRNFCEGHVCRVRLPSTVLRITVDGLTMSGKAMKHPSPTSSMCRAPSIASALWSKMHPATLAQDSLQQVLKAVEKAIAHQNSSAASTPGMAGNLTSQFPCLPHAHAANSTDQHIHLTDLWDQSHATGGNPTLSGEQDMHEFDFDVMTTDLLHFFGPSTEGNPTGNPS
ncbi:C6 zinc finger domain-containing protein [Verticillium alfalfae VaMs.102]|uniref:C6 zinc finger domain-containing protein n=1 Tax=Verticillium alfalfae (strain VaMs.102 / ATCC MYA-4576 / FGSC 10136) TaxID=526221 RepID=C9SEH8_VERA1|nr:C6 zinc finger domain-containing protein [Verticillium alfalfae VaMs.102]EEY16571.1 C6 zinc finger domain-containing protein [Verticillium alfalfae VaMs.102]